MTMLDKMLDNANEVLTSNQEYLYLVGGLIFLFFYFAYLNKQLKNYDYRKIAEENNDGIEMREMQV